MAARKPVLSPTRVCTYLDCPRKYRYVYLDKLPRYFGARAAFSFGVSLHRALQDYHAAGGPEAQSPEELVARLEQSWVRAGYESAAVEREQLSQGRDILVAYHETGAAQEGTTLFTEKMLRADMGEYILTGRVDRLDTLPDGGLEVIDYKSGIHIPTPEEVGEDLPLAIYQLLCVRQFTCDRVRASIYHLRAHRKISVVRDAGALAPIASGIDGVFSRIQQERQFPPVPGDHCSGCDFNTRCWAR